MEEGNTVSSSRSTEEVYDHHVQAFFGRDVNGLLEDTVTSL